MNHPDETTLLLYSDGELAADQAGAVRAHLETCAESRVRVDEFRAALEALASYKQKLAVALPPPPHPWIDIRERFGKSRGGFRSLLRGLAGSPRRWVPAAAAVVVLAAAIVHHVSETRHVGPAVAPPRESARPAAPLPAKDTGNEPAPAPGPSKPSAAAKPPAVEPPATPGEELAVFVALHRLGADLGEPIDVTRTAGGILVTGVGLDPQRAQEIRTALATLPRVVVRFSEPAAGVAEEPGRSQPVTPQRSPLGVLIEAHLGGRAPFEQFADRVLESSEAMMARAHALRRLSLHFPPEVEPQLDPSERQVLLGLHRDLTRAFIQREMEIQRWVDPVLRAASAVPTPPASPRVSAASWQGAVEALFDAASRVDRSISVVFAGASGESDPRAQHLAGQLARLRSASLAAEDWVR